MTESARVLVADDEPSIRFVLRETLESAGHGVTDVDDGDAALEALAGDAFDIAFFDIRMPGLSGLELLDRVCTLGSDVHSRALPSFSVIETMPVSATPKFAPLKPTSASMYLRVS